MKTLVLFLLLPLVAAGQYVDRDTLKSYFETGDFPTQQQFEYLIDAFYHRGETGLQDSVSLEISDSMAVIYSQLRSDIGDSLATITQMDYDTLKAYMDSAQVMDSIEAADANVYYYAYRGAGGSAADDTLKLFNNDIAGVSNGVTYSSYQFYLPAGKYLISLCATFVRNAASDNGDMVWTGSTFGSSNTMYIYASDGGDLWDSYCWNDGFVSSGEYFRIDGSNLGSIVLQEITINITGF